MKFITVACLTLAITFVACNGTNKNNKTVNGYEITYLSDGEGEKPTDGELAFVQLYFYMDGELQTSTRAQGRAMPVKVYSEAELKEMNEKGNANPVYDAIAAMSIGDSIIVNVPITEEMRKDERMTGAQEMNYHIVMDSSMTEDAYKALQTSERQKQSAMAEKTKAREAEVAATMSEIASKYSSGTLEGEMNKTDSGLKYMILEEGDGPAVEPGSNVDVHYYGLLTDGKMFDNSFKRGQPFNFPLGQGRVIKGWDEGVALLNKGDKAVLFIPSELGYGKAGAGENIPGDSELIFYIEVI